MTTVKPLEWTAEDNGEFIAMSPVGWYHIGFPCRSWNLTMPSGDVPSFGEDLEAAKAAAFADYSARIMSAIEPAGVGVETATCVIKDAFEDVGVEVGGTFARNLALKVSAALKGDEQ